MKRFVILFLFVSTLVSLYAKNEKAIIYVNDGSKLEVKIKMPNIHSPELVYYDDKLKEHKILSSKIDSMRVWNPEAGKDISYLLVYSDYYDFKNTKGEMVVKGTIWMFKVRSTEYITRYLSGFQFEIDKKGVVKMKSSRYFPSVDIEFWNYFQRPGEEFPTQIAPENVRGAISSMPLLKSRSAFYFKDCTEMVNYIKSKKFDSKNIDSIVELYPQLCK